jgi:palmitoyltransferase
VGRGNYRHFLALLLFTTFTLAYGTYLAYSTLMPEVRWHFENYPNYYLSHLSGQRDFVSRSLDGLNYSLDVFQTGLMIGGLRRAGVGLLAAMTWPLPLGLLAYHLYLIWAGTTTNETAKWEDWKEDMADGIVFVGDLRDADSEDNRGRERVPRRDVPRWPHQAKKFVVKTTDGQRPRFVAEGIRDIVVDDSWKQIWRLADVDNIYDLGFWGNLWDCLTN